MRLDPIVLLRSLFIVALFASALSTKALAQGQRGSLTGTVLSGEDDRPLVGVNVFLDGTSLGASSDRDGRFEITAVPVGSYVLVASQIGYRQVRRDVVVTETGPGPLTLRMFEESIPLGEVVAEADRPFSAASSMAIRAFDLRTRPADSAQDLLQVAPGLVVAQHAGGGKAEQIFLRGFDADHGTDVALDVDGVPVNMVSHGHGQGYADLHFLIPEIVERLDVRKGPYFASYGNLATAGAVSFKTKDHVSENLIRVEGGQFDTRAATMVYRIPTPGQHQGAYIAGQYFGSDGPVESPQSFRRANLFGKFHSHIGDNARVAVSASGFSSAWDASGQIPQRAVEQGLIGRFGAIDDLEGGTTSRQDINFRYEVEGPSSGGLTMQMFASKYSFKLFSNFTFFLEDPTDGDMIEQTDDRRIFGLNTKYELLHTIGSRVVGTTLGAGFRNDDVNVSLWQSPDRIRDYQLVGAGIRESNLFAFVQQEWILSPLFRAQLGLRADYFAFDVEDALEGVETTLPHASGYAQGTVVNPKANFVFSPVSSFDIFVNFGLGFHSNDARDVVITQRIEDVTRAMRRDGFAEAEIESALQDDNFDPDQRGAVALPRAVGGEIGLQRRFGSRIVISSALWALDLEEEFVYVGDAGTTEPSGATRRYGVDVETRVRINNHLSASADVNLSRGVFKDAPEDEDRVPLAPTRTATAGLTYATATTDVRLQLRHVGDRPANETGSITAEGATLIDLVAARSFGPFEAKVTLENLLDVAWNEAQFDTESRLRSESQPVSEIHFTPGNPFNLRAALTYTF